MAKASGVFFPAMKLYLCLLIAMDFSFALPRGLFPAEEDGALIAYPSTSVSSMSQREGTDAGSNNCYHFFVSQNMSSLLADATRMLRQVRDQREREWILTFIHRIKSLAEHIRSQPDSRNYDCLTDLESRRRMLGVRVQQPELYFEDEDPHNQKRSSQQQQKKPTDDVNASSESKERVLQAPQSPKGTEIDNQDNQHTNQQSINPPEEVKEDKSTPSEENIHPELDQRASESEPKHSQPEVVSSSLDKEPEQENDEAMPYHGATDNVIVLSADPNCEPRVGCGDPRMKSTTEESHYGSDDLLVQQLYTRNSLEEEQKEQEALKLRIKKALLEEMAPEVKKLRTVGGSQADLINLWKLTDEHFAEKPSEPYRDFDYEETGAAAGDLNSADRFGDSDPSVAPSLGEVKNSKRELGSSAKSPYDDSDVLVQQLFDVRFNEPPPKTTRSLSDQNEEYLITSTILPY